MHFLIVDYDDYDVADIHGPFETVKAAQIYARDYRAAHGIAGCENVEPTPEENEAWTAEGWYFGIHGVTKLTFLPRITITDTETNEQIATYYGPDAQVKAEERLDGLREVTPDAEYDLSVSDTQCPHCGDMFWHEASVEVETDDKLPSLHAPKWACPSCDEVIG
jgi:hypothetical protein